MLIRTGKLVSKFFSKGFFLRNGFCQGKLNSQGLHLNKQKADLSFEIYQLILKEPDPLDLKDKSLHDMIMEKIHQKSEITDMETSHQPDQSNNLVNDHTKQQGFKYSEQARKPFIDLFEKGYKIDQQIFPQQRFTHAKIQTDGPKKIIFHPTYLITKQVFKQLHWLQNAKKILIGHYGISKSVSVCLFWHLVKFMDEYRFQKGVTVSEQMKYVPKIVYLTLNKKIQEQQQYFKKMILLQCPEIMKEYNLPNWNQYNRQLQDIQYFYRRQFFKCWVILVIDQINYAAQLGKTFQNKEQLFENIQKRRQDKSYAYAKQLKELQQKVALFYEFKQNIELYLLKFSGLLGLSSMNLQYNFFEQISFSISTNTTVPQIDFVKYAQGLYKYQSLKQMASYFIFQMNQRVLKNLKNTKVSEVDQKEMKKQCFDELTKRLQEKQFFFFTHSDIIQSIISYKVENYNLPIQQLKILVKKTFISFVNSKTQTYKRQVQIHFEKKDKNESDSDHNKRIKLMLSMYQYLAQQHRYLSSKSRVRQISTIQVKTLPFKIYQNNQFLNKKLFRYISTYSKWGPSVRYICLMLPSSFLIQVIKPFVKKIFSIYTEVISLQIRRMKKQSQDGYLYKFTFLEPLNMGDFKLSFKLHNEIKKQTSQTYQFDIKDQIYTFQQLQKNPDQKPINLLKRFEEKIKQMRQKKLNSAVLFPVNTNCEKQKSQKHSDSNDVVSKSMKIDFAFIQNTQRSDLMSIWLVDPTPARQIEPKIKNFFQQFLKFSDKNVTQLPDIQEGLQVELNYVVLGPKHDIKHKDFKEVLKNQFGNEITLKTLDESNVFTVDKLADSESCLLKRVCYLQLHEHFDFKVINRQIDQFKNL